MEGKTLHLWGLSHHNTPLSVREKISFNEQDTSFAIQTFLKGALFQEMALISTCNRTEIYLVTEKGSNIKKKTEQLISKVKEACPDDISDFAYYMQKKDAIRHLFRVASGLDSMILGESQILGQVKKAYFLSQEASGAGLYLNRLFNTAIQTAKQIRTQTAIGEGSMSIAFAAVKLAQKIFKDLKEKKGLLIGAGKIGKLAAKNLRERSMGKIYLMNRTFSKAVRIANQIDATPLPWKKLSQTLETVDFVISSTDHNRYVIDKEMALKANLHKRHKPVLMIDIAVPRDIDPEIKNMENVFLHDIDDLNDIIEEGSTKRKQAIPEAMKLVEKNLNEFFQWSEYLKIRPTLIALKEKFHLYARGELNRHRKTMNQDEIESLEQAMEAFIEKLLRDPAKKLKEYTNGYLDGDTRIDVVREIFELKGETNKTK